jgi:trigger factor
VKLSDKFAKEEYRGKDAKLKLKVKEIKRLTPPEINEDFAKTLGFDSLEDLKSNIRKRVEIDKKRWVEDDLRNQILDMLLEQTKFELPQDLLSHHTEQRVYKHQLDLLNRGIPLEEIQKQTEAIKNASAESVMREIKASLILNHIAEKEKIFVTENEVEQQIADIARAYNTDTARVRKQLERRGNLSYLRSDMRENKVMNFLLKEAKVEE